MAVAFINASLDPRITVYRSYMYVSRDRGVQKSAVPASRKTMVSNTKNIEVCDRHARNS